MLKYLTIRKFSVESGYTEEAIRSKIKRGEWLEGVHWKKAPDGRVLMNPEAYEQWVEGQGCAPHLQAVSR